MQLIKQIESDIRLKKIIRDSHYISDLIKLNKKQINIKSVILDNKLQESEIISKWIRSIASDNQDIFRKRLQWDGLDLETILLMADNHDCLNIETENEEKWVETLKNIIKTSLQIGSYETAKSYQDLILSPFKSEIPFKEIFCALIKFAREELLANIDADLRSNTSTIRDLTNAAYLQLEQGLLKTLFELWIKTLEHEFNLVRPFGQSLLSLLNIDLKQDSGKNKYCEFIDNILHDGFLSWFEKYPVLGRMTAEAIQLWIKSTSIFLQQLHEDLPKIVNIFCDSNDLSLRSEMLGQVIAIEHSLSDRHEQGQTVIGLTFASGLKLVYKPKSMGLDAAYNQILVWLNQNNVPLDFKSLKVLDCGTHGWVEYVEYNSCDNEAAAQRFYQRSGQLLCLLHLLSGTDCHYENLIAHGEYPVLIDTETLMHPEVQAVENTLESMENLNMAQVRFWDSVLQVGLLPRWEIGHENSNLAYDISGLGSSSQLQGTVPEWTAVNTDKMSCKFVETPLLSQANIPYLDDVALSAYDYLDDILIGFQHMYRFLLTQRQILLSEDSILHVLKGKRVRLIFRDTRIYSELLNHSISPQFLRNGILRSIELDALSRVFLASESKPSMWPILQAELASMAQLDIPYFAGLSDSTDLTVGVSESIPDYFLAPSYNKVLSRLQNLSEEDAHYQTVLIRGAFYGRVAQSVNRNAAQPACPAEVESASGPAQLVSQDTLLQEAQRLADEIAQNALSGEDGSKSWIGLAFHPHTGRYQFRPLGDSLYHGNAGIALFLAACDRLTHSNRYADLVEGALKPALSLLQTPHLAIARRYLDLIGIGGGTGLGSILYALVRISTFQATTRWTEASLTLIDRITQELIAADRSFDAMGGTAGMLLGLLALYQATQMPEVLKKAQDCGYHLCQHQIVAGDHQGGWVTLNGHCCTGLSHGAAGIAYALLQLYKVSDDPKFLQAATAGIAYEQHVFCKSQGNWPDYRFEPAGYNISTWCHGAAGIALARLGGLNILNSAAISQEIEIALTTTQKYRDSSMDHLCCGGLGQSELFLTASQVLSRPDLLAQEMPYVAWILNRARAEGGYRLFPNIQDKIFNPVFFQGTAGIGYECLRLALPDQVPSVLLWA